MTISNHFLPVPFFIRSFNIPFSIHQQICYLSTYSISTKMIFIPCHASKSGIRAFVPYFIFQFVYSNDSAWLFQGIKNDWAINCHYWSHVIDQWMICSLCLINSNCESAINCKILFNLNNNIDKWGRCRDMTSLTVPHVVFELQGVRTYGENCRLRSIGLTHYERGQRTIYVLFDKCHLINFDCTVSWGFRI